ncbi:MAG: ABC transporter substrate-binding protein [Pseudomonadota bacterium]
MKNKWVSVAVLAVLVSLSGCRSAVGRGGGTIIVATQFGPLTLDPRLVTDAEGDKISSLICDGLLARNSSLELVPALAERYERISDTSYRFFLRHGATFGDGSELTSADVVYTFRSIMDGKIASPLRAAFDRIADVVAEKPDVVRIDLKEVYAPFLSMLTRGIVSASAAEGRGAAFARDPICVGPYRLVRFVADSVVELSANPAYYGGAPKNSKLVFEIVKDDNIRVMKLMKGDVDLVQNSIPPMLIDSLKKNPALREIDEVGTVMTYLGFNLTDPALSDKRVRQAIAYAIDRDEIIAHRWRGLAVKANSILSPGNWAYDADLPQYQYNPAKAAKLLDEAGFGGPEGAKPAARLKLKYKTSTVKERIDVARMISDQLSKVGIAARVEPYEWGTFFRDVGRGNFQIYTLSWVGIFEPDIFYEVCQSSRVPPNGLNRGRYKNPEVDRLVQEGRQTMDQAKRRAIYAEVQKIVLDDLPFIPLWYEKNVIVYRDGLSGVSLRPDASYRTFVNVEK